MENRELEAWADALLDQHRSAPRPHTTNALALGELDALSFSRMQQPDPAAPMQRMYMVVGIAGAVLVLLFLLALMAA